MFPAQLDLRPSRLDQLQPPPPQLSQVKPSALLARFPELYLHHPIDSASTTRPYFCPNMNVVINGDSTTHTFRGLDNITTFADCCTECRQNSSCRVFVYSRDTLQCWLKTAMLNFEVRHDCCILAFQWTSFFPHKRKNPFAPFIHEYCRWETP